MKKNRITSAGLLLFGGVFVAGLAGCDTTPAAATAPRTKSGAAHLGYTKKLTNVKDIDSAVTLVKGALKAQGFGIITRINVQAVMKKKLGVEGKPYWILGACNPKLAHKALTADPYMGLLLPCKVIVFQADDGSFMVSFARPQALFGLVNNPHMATLAAQVDARMKAAFDAL